MTDPTPQIKALFADLLMQIALLQTQLEECKKEISELKNTADS